MAVVIDKQTDYPAVEHPNHPLGQLRMAMPYSPNQSPGFREMQWTSGYGTTRGLHCPVVRSSLSGGLSALNGVSPKGCCAAEWETKPMMTIVMMMIVMLIRRGRGRAMESTPLSNCITEMAGFPVNDRYWVLHRDNALVHQSISKLLWPPWCFDLNAGALHPPSCVILYCPTIYYMPGH